MGISVKNPLASVRVILKKGEDRSIYILEKKKKWRIEKVSHRNLEMSSGGFGENQNFWPLFVPCISQHLKKRRGQRSIYIYRRRIRKWKIEKSLHGVSVDSVM
jgi:hypothetical protein